MHGPPSLTKSFQLHGLELVCLEVHIYVISIGVLARRRFAPAVLRTYKIGSQLI